MKKTREIIAQGLAQRAGAKIKVRQPLAKATIFGITNYEDGYIRIIEEELNVKEVKRPHDLGLEDAEKIKASPIKDFPLSDVHIEVDTRITEELRTEGTARELIRQIQSARKKANFNVEDRIVLALSSEMSQITDAYSKFKDLIWAETLTTGELTDEAEYSEDIKIDGQAASIKLARKK